MDTRSSFRQSELPASQLCAGWAKSAAEVRRVRKDVGRDFGHASTRGHRAPTTDGSGETEIAQFPPYGSITAFLALRGDFFSALGGALTGFDSEAALRVALRALAGARALPPRAPCFQQADGLLERDRFRGEMG